MVGIIPFILLPHLSDAVLVGNYVSEQTDNLIGHFVDQARKSGASWSQIGTAMGVSKQAAQQRWVPRWSDLLTFGRNFDRFTPRARNVLAYANKLAGGERAAEIRPEHLVVAQFSEPEAVSAKVLEQLGVEEATLATALKVNVAPAADVSPIGFDEDAMTVLDATLREALRLGHNYIGTEHLLLGVLAIDGLDATGTLRDLGVTKASVEPLVRESLTAMTRGR
jgi:hypothetical protein